VAAILDEEDESLKSKDAHDNNSYLLGRMCQHNVVITCLPAGVYGVNAAATVAKDMLRTCIPRNVHKKFRFHSVTVLDEY
jgi:hypothetical protein